MHSSWEITKLESSLNKLIKWRDTESISHCQLLIWALFVKSTSHLKHKLILVHQSVEFIWISRKLTENFYEWDYKGEKSLCALHLRTRTPKCRSVHKDNCMQQIERVLKTTDNDTDLGTWLQSRDNENCQSLSVAVLHMPFICIRNKVIGSFPFPFHWINQTRC